MALKHVGRTVKNQMKVGVVYRTLPGDPESCLVVNTVSLAADEHDSLMKTIESAMGQEAHELGDAMARSFLPDGRNMLEAFHKTGKMMKLPTSDVEMVPDRNNIILLSELNTIIAEQRGVTLDELSIKPDAATSATTTEETTDTPVTETLPPEVNLAEEQPLTDEELAAQYRSQADRLYKEAKRLREQAEELVPTKRKKVAEKA